MNGSRYDCTIDRYGAGAMSGEVRRAAAAPQTRLRFSGFGRFRVEVDGATAPLPPITCTMLARLVLARGGLVDADDLYRDSWPDPALKIRRDQRVAVHKRIAEIRRYLGSERQLGDRSVLLTERSARTGYRLVLDADQVDIHRFEDLICRAGATQDQVAVDLLVQALTLWTEHPLLGLPDKAFVHEGISRLTSLRNRACRELAEVCCALGRPRDALAAFDRLQTSQHDDVGLRELIDQLRRDAHRMGMATSDVRAAHRLPAPWNAPVQMYDVGPHPQLGWQAQQQPAGGPVPVVEMLEVGRSQLGDEFEHPLAARYRLVWWPGAQHPELVAVQLTDLTPRTGIVDSAPDVPTTAAELRRPLRTLTSDGLLVFDDAPTPGLSPDRIASTGMNETHAA